MDPWKSWGIVGAVGAGAYYYYSKSNKAKRGRGQVQPVPPHTVRPDSKRRGESSDRQKKDDNSGVTDCVSDAAEVSSASLSDSVQPKKRKGSKGKSKLSQVAQSSAVGLGSAPVKDNEDVGDDGIDNIEFARQFADLRMGTSLKKPASSNEAKKTNKQGKQNEEAASSQTNGGKMNGVNGVSTTSSSTGADTDDDLSLAGSPALAATQSSRTPDVSDMLEAPTKGPSIIRITPSAEPERPNKPKLQKVVSQPETKKQRQRRKKAEEERAFREQVETERRVLMEKQRRTAREAEGRPAKNGLGTSQQPAKNAWAESLSVPSTSGNNPLLDTFEDTPATSVASHSSNDFATEKSWDPSKLPSEEEQMRQLLSPVDEDDGWSTVPKGGKSKKKATAKITEADSKLLAEDSNPATDTKMNGKSSLDQIPTPDHASNTTPSRIEAIRETLDPNVWNRNNIHLHPEFDDGYPYALLGHPEDSDWAAA